MSEASEKDALENSAAADNSDVDAQDAIDPTADENVADIADESPAEQSAELTEEAGDAENSDAEADANAEADVDAADNEDEDEAIAPVVSSADDDEDVDPIEDVSDEGEDEVDNRWYILKVQVNRENSICDALDRRVKIGGLEKFFGDILVPTEEVREFTKSGKARDVKKKLYPGYIVVNMTLNDDTWFLVRETPGIGDFTGSAGKPSPLSQAEIEQILRTTKPKKQDDPAEPKIGIKFKVGDRVRVKEGNFENFEGEVDAIDESTGEIRIIINIFNRATPLDLKHWQVEEL